MAKITDEEAAASLARFIRRPVRRGADGLWEFADGCWRAGLVRCSTCGHRWGAAWEESAGVPRLGGLECPACGAMRGTLSQ